MGNSTDLEVRRTIKATSRLARDNFAGPSLTYRVMIGSFQSAARLVARIDPFYTEKELKVPERCLLKELGVRYT